MRTQELPTVTTVNRQAIAGYIRREELHIEQLGEHFPELTYDLGNRAIHLIRADENTAGTFKWRGATRAVDLLARRGETRIVTASAGNHARGVMLAAAERKLEAVIVVPNSAPAQKSTDLATLWAQTGQAPDRLTLIQHGDTFEEAYHYTRETYPNVPFVHPYDDLAVIDGQGTLSGDIDRAIPGLTDLIVPVGGGGLLAGLQGAYRNRLRLHAVQAQGSDSLLKSLSRTYPEPAEASNPNQLFGGSAVSKIGENVLRRLWTHHYDGRNIHTVADDDVRELAFFYHERSEPQSDVIEPTALVAIAGVLKLLRFNQLAADAKVGVLVTGHNEGVEKLLSTDVKYRSHVSRSATPLTPPNKR